MTRVPVKRSTVASARKPRRPAARPQDNRRRAILDVAARLFGTRGYDSVSIRDITREVGMLPGSLYYHFPSKEDLLLAVHAEGVAHIKRAVEDSISGAADDAWSKLRVACVAHLEALLGGSDYTQVVSPQFPRAFPKALRTRMISQRDSYETLFAGLVAALPVPSGVDRRHLRLAMLGSLNWALTWYRPGADTPRRIAEQIVDLYRMQLDPAAPTRR